MKDFFKKKVIQPLLELLKQGVTPQKLAISLSAGVAICIFPILGTTTFLCFIFAAFFRLNHIAIQIANYVTYPLQIILIIPLLKMGNWIFGLPVVQFDLAEMTLFFQESPLGFFKTYGLVALRGCIAWAVFAPLVAGLLYFVLYPILKKYSPIKQGVS